MACGNHKRLSHLIACLILFTFLLLRPSPGAAWCGPQWSPMEWTSSAWTFLFTCPGLTTSRQSDGAEGFSVVVRPSTSRHRRRLSRISRKNYQTALETHCNPSATYTTVMKQLYFRICSKEFQFQRQKNFGQDSVSFPVHYSRLPKDVTMVTHSGISNLSSNTLNSSPSTQWLASNPRKNSPLRHIPERPYRRKSRPCEFSWDTLLWGCASHLLPSSSCLSPLK